MSQEEKEEIKEMYKNDIVATIENKTAISRAGLQALIVSDFTRFTISNQKRMYEQNEKQTNIKRL